MKAIFDKQDRVNFEYKHTPHFRSMRAVSAVLDIAYVVALLYYLLSDNLSLPLSIVMFALALLPIAVHIFAHVSPVSAYKKFVLSLTQEEYEDFLADHAQGKKYIAAKPTDPCIVTFGKKYLVIAKNPVTVISMDDVTWIYQRVFETPEKAYDFIDIHTSKGFHTFTFENMSDTVADEIISAVKAANANVRVGADE